MSRPPSGRNDVFGNVYLGLHPRLSHRGLSARPEFPNNGGSPSSDSRWMSALRIDQEREWNSSLPREKMVRTSSTSSHYLRRVRRRQTVETSGADYVGVRHDLHPVGRARGEVSEFDPRTGG